MKRNVTPRASHGSRAFTIIELFVVIAIIAIIAALFLAPGSHLKPGATIPRCMNNLRQICVGWMAYANDAEAKVKRSSGATNLPAPDWIAFKKQSQTYIRGDRAFECPKDKFYFEMSGGAFKYVNKPLHDQDSSDHSSYAFNGGNAGTNSNLPGIAGRTLASIRDPANTV